MSGVFSCTEVRSRARARARRAGGAERAEAVLHVNGCARCQALVAEYAEVADLLPSLAPEHEPPAGFEARTLARLGARLVVRRRRLLVVAAVAAAVAAIVAPPRCGGRVDDRQRYVQAGGGGDGRRVGRAPAGWAYVTEGQSVAVAVDYGVPDGEYTVRVDPAVGPASDLGAMTVAGGRGSFTGHSIEPLSAGSSIAARERRRRSDASRHGGLNPLGFRRQLSHPADGGRSCVGSGSS